MDIDKFTKPCSSMSEVIKPVGGKALCYEEQRTYVDLTHFSKYENVHSPQKKSSKVFRIIMGDKNCQQMKSILVQLLKEWWYNKLNGLHLFCIPFSKLSM